MFGFKKTTIEDIPDEFNALDWLDDYPELWDEWYMDDLILQRMGIATAGVLNLCNHFFIGC